MSTKNQLQEYFAKRGMPLPEYQTNPHARGFISIVKFQGVKISGIPSGTKKEAEKKAAERALQYLGDTVPSENANTEPYSPPSDPQYLLMIDLENIPKIDIDIPDNVLVYGFISHTSHLYGMIEQYRDRMFVEVAYSSVKDAADILLGY